jgi:uncharacterized protein
VGPPRTLTGTWARPHISQVATVIDGDFEWDAAKSVTNEQKHGIKFEEAAVALFDPRELAVEDPNHPGRVCSLVMSPRTRVLYVVTTEAGPRTRIISARKATTHERRRYEAG